VKNLAGLLSYVLRHEKKKIFIFGLFILFFLVVLFPFSDLSDFVTAQISKATNNQVFVQFRSPGLSLFPGVGFELKEVHLETSFLPPIKARSVTVSPSLLGLLTFRPGVKLNVSQVLGGNVDLSLQKANLNGKPGQAVSLDTEGVELSQVLELTSSHFPVSGKMNLTASAEIEPTFVDPPTAQVEAQINKFDLSSDTIATPLGPLNLPPLSLKQINLKGELREGRFLIDQFVAGQPGDELSANVKGRMEVRVQPGPFVQPGAFDLEVRISAKESFKQKAGLFLSFLNSYQKPGPNGTTVYAFRIKGSSFNAPPNLSAL
jgi:type II secretion system protein N